MCVYLLSGHTSLNTLANYLQKFLSILTLNVEKNNPEQHQHFPVNILNSTIRTRIGGQNANPLNKPEHTLNQQMTGATKSHTNSHSHHSIETGKV